MKMMKSAVILGALLAAAAPVGAQTVEASARTGWDQMPPVKIKSVYLDVSLLSDWAERLFASGECKLPGQRANKFDIDERYAVLVEPGGTVQRIVIAGTGCAGLNTLLGSTIHRWAERGEFRPTGAQEPRWYSGRITFARE
jgi:hypothetical protein